MAELIINQNKCSSCRKCIGACPYSALEMADGAIALDREKCCLCGACVRICPENAITLSLGRMIRKDDINSYSGVWVFGEQTEGVISPIVYQLLAKGRELADKRGCDLELVLLGGGIGREAIEECLADSVILINNDALEHYEAGVYAEVMGWLCSKFKPEIILAGATAIGRSLMPRIATLCHTGLTADCTGLDIDDEGKLVQTRPAFGGNIMAEIICPEHRPQMATVRGDVFKAEATGGIFSGEIRELELPERFTHSRVERISYEPEPAGQTMLNDADIIIAGGRGIGSAEGFELLERVAQKIGAAVGASRAAVELGWYPYTHQIGQTGKTVNPKIYIACGISGAIQHRIGISGADTIIAINTNPHAPICEHADYVVTGDWRQIINGIESIIGSY